MRGEPPRVEQGWCKNKAEPTLLGEGDLQLPFTAGMATFLRVVERHMYGQNE